MGRCYSISSPLGNTFSPSANDRLAPLALRAPRWHTTGLGAAPRWELSAPVADSGVQTELQALPASFFELPASRSSNLLDSARVCAVLGSEMHTRTVLSRREPQHSKVPGLNCVRDVVSAHLTPTQQILWRDQDAAVGASSTARSARQAVEHFSHRLEIMARIPRGARGRGGLCAATVI
jgi:hypothetical protein